MAPVVRCGMALVSFLFTDVAAQTPETRHVDSADGCFLDQCEEESQAFVLLQTKARIAKKSGELPGESTNGELGVPQGGASSSTRPTSPSGRIAQHWEGAAAKLAKHVEHIDGHLNKQPVSARGRLAQHFATAAEGAYSLMQAKTSAKAKAPRPQSRYRRITERLSKVSSGAAEQGPAIPRSQSRYQRIVQNFEKVASSITKAQEDIATEEAKSPWGSIALSLAQTKSEDKVHPFSTWGRIAQHVHKAPMERRSITVGPTQHSEEAHVGADPSMMEIQQWA